MSFFSRLLGRFAGGGRGGRTVTTTVRRPFVIRNPVIGFLNLLGEAGAGLVESDSRALSHLFVNSRMSDKEVPQCGVLFVYCRIDPSGRVAASDESLRALIKRAAAYVAVIASENEGDACMKALKDRNDWPCNVVFVLNRKGPKFAEFFRRLFEMMGQGTSMPMAWVKLAPQIPNYDNPDVPDSVFAAEAGHVTFGKA